MDWIRDWTRWLRRPGDWGNWPRPLDDADQPQVERDPPDRPGTRCGAER
ncbi:hypothetical protein [Azospirillum himalayense]|uniref:Uncharacterized protein n=1 Tax=Azospirillum himalayense TaxID=654847 RepID=A0ABW0GDB6_9PROT